MNDRTKEEKELALEEMEDIFYPPHTQWDSPCSECGEEKLHKSKCGRRSRSMFKGWGAYIKKTKTPDGKCDKKDCNKKAEMRIRLNVWGTIVEYDTCHEHGTHGGKSRDGFLCDEL
jgi:hypothetical protein